MQRTGFEPTTLKLRVSPSSDLAQLQVGDEVTAELLGIPIVSDGGVGRVMSASFDVNDIVIVEIAAAPA